jgi:hypothetical protein
MIPNKRQVNKQNQNKQLILFFCNSFLMLTVATNLKKQSDRTQDSLKHIFIQIYFSIITAEPRTPVDVQLIARNPR